MNLSTYSRVVHGMYCVHLLGSVYDNFELALVFAVKAVTVNVQPFRLVEAVEVETLCKYRKYRRKR